MYITEKYCTMYNNCYKGHLMGMALRFICLNVGGSNIPDLLLYIFSFYKLFYFCRFANWFSISAIYYVNEYFKNLQTLIEYNPRFIFRKPAK